MSTTSLPAYRIGPWEFSPRDNELRQGSERRRLEDRAARTLALLCRHRGETVPNAAIIDEVWQGRQLSPNSVAVVISDLRAALDDDARTPRHIETVAKRGYRLLDGAAPEPATATPWRRRLVLIGTVLLIAVGAVAWAYLRAAPDRPIVAFSQVINDTRSPRYDPVARSVDGLIVAGLRRGRVRQIRPMPGQALPPGSALLEARLILWTGNPTVNFTVTDSASREVVWSGMAPGPPRVFPLSVAREMEQFTASRRPADR